MLNNVINKVQQVFNQQELGHVIDWSDDFSGATELEALIEAKDQLTKIDLLTKKDLKVKIKLVLSLDASAYRKIQSVTHNYLTTLRDNDSLRKSIEAVVYEYLRRLYATYMLILDEALGQQKLQLSESVINLILARYLNTLFAMAKWRYFDDQPAPLGVWTNVHKVVRLAEELLILDRNLFLYDFQKNETNIATILYRGFMLDSLQKGGYTQLQVELTERVLKTWSNSSVIAKDYAHDEYQFFIHLEEDKRPERLRGAKGHPDFRYWKTTRIVDLVESYLCAVDTGKPLDIFNLNNMAATEDFVQLFKKLRVEWCVEGYKRQRRVARRKPATSMIDVCHGVEDICLRVRRLRSRSGKSKASLSTLRNTALHGGFAPTNDGILLESVSGQFNTLGTENWVMLEESETGFSVVLAEEKSPWVKSGVLIGYSNQHDSNILAIAEIKTVRKRVDGSYRLGLLKITKHAIAIKVSLLQKTNVFDTVEGYEVDDGLSYSADFLSLFIDEGEGAKSKLIVPRNMYKRAHRYKVKIHGEYREVLAGEVVNKHHNWVCFEVVV